MKSGPDVNLAARSIGLGQKLYRTKMVMNVWLRIGL